MARHLTFRRLLFLIPVLVLALALTFFLTRVTGTDPLARVQSPFLTAEQRQAERDELHLNDPIAEQFVVYVSDVVRGDFGISYFTGRPVLNDLVERLAVSLELMVVGMLFAIVVGGGLGLGGALRPGSLIDHGGRALALLGVSVPVFWSTLLLLFVFFFELGWLPGPGLPGGADALRITGSPVLDAVLHGDLSAAGAALEALVLPGLALGFALTPITLRVVRQSAAEALGSEFVRSAYGLGLSTRTIVFQHALPAASPPILTMLGLLTGFAIGGNIIVEIVFSRPGIGLYVYEATLNNDFPAIEGFVLLITAIYVVIFLIVDVAVAWIDPRGANA